MSLLLLFQSAPGGGSYTLAGDAAAFVLTGQAADLKAGRRLTADAGAYNETGQAATLKAGREINGDAGAFTLTGQSAGLLTGRRIAGDAGAYTLTGQDAALAKARGIVGEAGAYVVSGQNADLLSTATEPTQELPQGGHYWPDVKQDDWRERSQKQRRELLERIINGVEDAPAEIKEEVADIVRPYRQGARLTRASLDRLADNLRAVERLLAAYQEYIDDEDAAAILLMS